MIRLVARSSFSLEVHFEFSPFARKTVSVGYLISYFVTVYIDVLVRWLERSPWNHEVGGSILDRDKCFTDIFVHQSIKKIIADNLIVYLTSHNTAKRQILCVTVFVVVHC